MGPPLQKIHCLYDQFGTSGGGPPGELRHRVKLVALARPVWLVADVPTIGVAKSRIVGKTLSRTWRPGHVTH